MITFRKFKIHIFIFKKKLGLFKIKAEVVNMPGHVWRTRNMAEFVDVAISSLPDCTYLPSTNRYRNGPKPKGYDLPEQLYSLSHTLSQTPKTGFLMTGLI